MMGNMDNWKNTMHLAQTFVQVMEQIHRHYWIDKKAGVDNLKVLKDDYAYSLGMPVPSVGQWIQIAILKGEIWDLHITVIKGGYQMYDPKAKTSQPEITSMLSASDSSSKKKSKKNLVAPPCKSVSFFTSLGGVPPELVMVWLKAVLNGTAPLRGLHDLAKTYKGTLRVQREIASTLVLKNMLPAIPEKINTKNQLQLLDQRFKTAQKKFKNATEDKFVNAWAIQAARWTLKQAFPAKFKTDLQAKLDKDTSVQVQPPPDATTSTININDSFPQPPPLILMTAFPNLHH
jgi:hypothetical protein